MNTNLITFEDKVSISQNPSIPDKNKISSTDVNQIKIAINSGLLNLIYPVGCYFETSDTSFNPNASWGGTWELDIDGTVLVSCSSGEDSKFNVAVGTIVGEETHTLTINEMPEHAHNQKTTNQSGSQTDGYAMTGNYNLFNSNTSTETEGGSQPHNNIQPSKIINRWHRTA